MAGLGKSKIQQGEPLPESNLAMESHHWVAGRYSSSLLGEPHKRLAQKICENSLKIVNLTDANRTKMASTASVCPNIYPLFLLNRLYVSWFEVNSCWFTFIPNSFFLGQVPGGPCHQPGPRPTSRQRLVLLCDSSKFPPLLRGRPGP